MSPLCCTGARRRNRYQIQAHLPLPGAGPGEPAIGEVLALLAGTPPGPVPEGPGQ